MGARGAGEMWGGGVRAHCNSLRVGAIVGISVGFENGLAHSRPPFQCCLAGHPIGVKSMNVTPYKHTHIRHILSEASQKYTDRQATITLGMYMNQ